jgi:urease accessory protein UreF
MSACQRLMPLGQGRAGQLLWNLQPAIVAAAAATGAASFSACDLSDTASSLAGRHDGAPFPFTALLDVASMRHPQRSVRLFIS